MKKVPSMTTKNRKRVVVANRKKKPTWIKAMTETLKIKNVRDVIVSNVSVSENEIVTERENVKKREKERKNANEIETETEIVVTIVTERPRLATIEADIVAVVDKITTVVQGQVAILGERLHLARRVVVQGHTIAGRGRPLPTPRRLAQVVRPRLVRVVRRHPRRARLLPQSRVQAMDQQKRNKIKV